MKNMIKQLD